MTIPVRPDEMRIPQKSIEARDVAVWWAKQGNNVQAEFLKMMMDELTEACKDGIKCMQLMYISDELDFDTKYDLQELVNARRKPSE